MEIPEQNSSEFLFLIRGGGEKLSSFSPQEMQVLMAEYLQWIDKLTKNGELKEALPLEDSGAVIRSDNYVGNLLSITQDETIGGFFMIYAKNLDHAKNIAKDCPVLRLGGAVEIRPITFHPQ